MTGLPPFDQKVRAQPYWPLVGQWLDLASGGVLHACCSASHEMQHK